MDELEKGYADLAASRDDEDLAFRDAQRTRRGYVKQDDGTWSPTPARLAEMIRLCNEGDPEYLASLVKVERNPDTGNYEPVD